MARIRTEGDFNATFTARYSTLATTYNCVSYFPDDQVPPENPLNTKSIRGPDPARYMMDDLTPGYFTKVKRGEILPVQDCLSRKSVPIGIREFGLSWVFSRTRPSNCQNGKSSYNRIATRVIGWPVAKPNLPDLLDPSVLVPDAIADFRSRIWDMGTFLAEFGKTADLLLQAGKRFSDRVERISAIVGKRHGGKRADASTFLAEFSSAWLEARYGWRILAYDIEALQEAYQHLARDTPHFRGSAKITESTTTFTDWLNVGNASYRCQLRWKCETTKVARAFCGGTHNIDLPARIDPLLTAYEVIPYSFVADWFFNIGANLEAYSPFAAGELIYVGTVAESVQHCVGEIRMEFPTDGPITKNELHFDGPLPTLQQKQYQRRRVNNPGIDVRFRTRLNAFKVADIAALILQRANPLRALARR